MGLNRENGDNSEANFNKKDPYKITCCKYYKEFAANTSLNGVKYTSENDKSLPIRIWWAIMVIMSFFLCSYLIAQVWDKWDKSPVIVSFAETSTPIWQIPYPAITICPLSKFNKDKFNYTKVCTNGLNSTEEDLKLYDVLGTMCLDQCLTEKGRTVETVDVADFVSIINNYSLKMDDIFSRCYTKNVDNCEELFTPIVTDIGLCYTYNMLNAEDIYKENVIYDKKSHLNTTKSKGWTLENGYPKDEPFKTHPNRGSKADVAVMLKYDKKEVDFLCNGVYRGFQLAIHSPNTIPQLDKNFLWIPAKLETIISVKPQMIKSSNDITKYDPKRRGCFFSNERNLKYFIEYSQSNCDIECLTNYTLEICNCVPYYMPRLDSMPICASAKIDCIKNASEKYDAMIGQFDDEGDVDSPAQRCNCLPSCTSLEYDIEISQVKLDWKKYLEALRDDTNDMPSMVASINIAFKSAQFIPSKRSELYGITDFLANCGGLIGLCTGFSILTLVEIFYFFVIRDNSSGPKDPERITFCKYFKEFAVNSSLHGVKYTTERDKSIWTRIWWAIMLIISFFLCICLIFNVWNKWNYSPVIVSFAEISTPIWQIPYPAITICPMASFKKAKFSYSDLCNNEGNITEENLKLYDTLAMMCIDQCLEDEESEVETIDIMDLESIIDEYCIKGDEIFRMCTKKVEANCEELFTPIITDSGLCYTYNMLRAEDIYRDGVYFNEKYNMNSTKSKGWTLENGYHINEPFNTYPHRGARTNIGILLKYNTEDVDYLCNGIYKGFQIIIHPPNTVPKPRDNFLWLPVELETIITIKPQMIKSSDAIRNYSPKSRGCFFSSERELKYFKEYSQSNCNTECLVDFTIEMCKCAPYYSPRFRSTSICAAAKFKCVRDAADEYEAMSELGTVGKEEVKATPAQRCNCLPSCTSLDYDFEISQVKLEWESYLAEMSDVNYSNIPSKVASVSIGFKSAQFIPSKRSELYGLTDFLANCGGLIGVCTGFSILTFAEIFYFFIIRVVSDVRNKIKPKKEDHIV